MRNAVVALVAAAISVVVAPDARASPSARLIYSRARGAESCADDAALRRSVASRVGYDPFFAWAKKTVVASVSPVAPRGFVVRVYLIDEQGVEHGARELRTESGECQELLDAAALAIAIAIDPQALVPRPTPTPEPAPEPPAAELSQPDASPRSVEDRSPRPPPKVNASSPFVLDTSAGVIASTGVAPGPALGVALGLAWNVRRLSLGIEGRVDAPASADAIRPDASTDVASVSSLLVVGAVVPCYTDRPLFLCAIAQAGAMHATGQTRGGLSAWTDWWAVGGRFGVLMRLVDWVDLRFRSDVLADLSHPTLWLNGVVAWNAPLVAASLGADVVAHFR